MLPLRKYVSLINGMALLSAPTGSSLCVTGVMFTCAGVPQMSFSVNGLYKYPSPSSVPLVQVVISDLFTARKSDMSDAQNFRSTFEGFIGQTNPTGLAATGASGTFGDADEYAIVTTSQGLVTFGSQSAINGGATAVSGDATNCPVLTVVNGRTTATSTQPLRVATGFPAGVYGAEYSNTSLAILNTGIIPFAELEAVKLPSVFWTGASTVTYGGGTNMSFSTVAYNTGNIISQTGPGIGMTVLQTGKYFATAFVQLQANIAGSPMLLLLDDVPILMASGFAAETDYNVSGVLSITAGQVLTTDFAVAYDTTAQLRGLSLTRIG